MAVWKLIAVVALIHCATTSREGGLVSAYENKTESEIKLKIISDVVTDFEAIMTSSQESGEISQSSQDVPSNNSNNLFIIEEQMQVLKEELKILKNSSTIVAEDLSKVNSIETTVDKVNSRLDDLKKDIDKLGEKYKGEKQELIDKLQYSMMNCIVQSLIWGQYRFAGNLIGKVDGSFLLPLIKFVHKSTGIDPNQTKEMYCNSLKQDPSSKIRLFVTAFRNNAWATVKKLSQEITNLCVEGYQILTIIYNAVIDNVYGEIGITTILEKGHLNLDLSGYVMLQVAVCRKLELTGNLDGGAGMNLASHIKMATEHVEYKSISPFLSALHKSCIDKLPPSMKIIVSSSFVYLKSITYGEYLYADEEVETVDDTQRRSVYTWTPENTSDSQKFQWKLSFLYYKSFNLINRFDEALYTCADCAFSISPKRRHVYAGAVEESIAISKTWELEDHINGTFRIKNERFQEYLHPYFYEPKDDKLRFVFTSRNETPDNVWQLIDGEVALN